MKTFHFLSIRSISIIIIFLLILFFAPYLKQKCADGQCSLNNIEHTITYSQKDTRSEAQHGHLFINGKEVPDIFKTVICGNTKYVFYQRKGIWGMDGYFPLMKDENSPKISRKTINKKTLLTGWYSGKTFLKGTPSDWLYLEWDDGSAFCSASAIDDLIKSQHLKTIPRMEVMKIKAYK